MDAKEFNQLLQSHKNDVTAANELHLYCLTIIKKRLLFRNGSNDLESLAHSILERFIANPPDKYIFTPVSYLNKCTDNFLSNLKRKESREIALTQDLSYEQSFDALETVETFRQLEEYIGKEDAYLVYGHCVERVEENQLAKEIGISYTAARQRISRALKKLKKILKKDVTKLDFF